MHPLGLKRRGLLGASAALSAGAVALGVTAPAFAQLAGFPDPADRTGRRVEVNGASIFVQATGQGRPMLLLHGYPLSGALFSRVRDQLSTRFRVITIDHRGYGKSTGTAFPASIEAYAKDALDVMDALGIGRAVIGGMSMGGPIAFEMYQRAASRFRGLILIDTIAAAASLAEAGLWRGVADQAREAGRNGILRFLIKDLLTGQTRRNEPALVNYLTAIMAQASQDAAVGGALALAGRPDYTPLLGRIRVPTLVLVGAEDTVYPFETSRDVSRNIADAELAIIPGASHAAILEAPDRSAGVILSWADRAGV